ncbi:hypothetical protein ACQP3F_26980, partial [Escherichia coli]
SMRETHVSVNSHPPLSQSLIGEPSGESHASSGSVQDSDSTKTGKHVQVSKTSADIPTKSTGREWESQSPNVILAQDNDRGSSAIQEQLFIEQLSELEDSLGNLSPPDFFENFSFLDLF